MKKTTRSLLLAVVVSAISLLVCASPDEPIRAPPAIQIRALVAVSSTLPTQSSTAAAPTSTPATTSAAATSSSAAQVTTSSTPAASAAPSQSPAASPAASATPAAPSAAQTSSSSAQAVVTSAVATTDSAGVVVTSYIQYTPTPSDVSPSPTQASNDSSGGGGGGGGGGLSTGSIVGLSVSGGIAALAIILFFVWKFTRKRFADFDDNEAIKWPELNAHNNDVHALPTNSTGRAGFGPENESDVNLTRPPSPGSYANSISGASAPEGYGAGDPYAVPPLPHLNPNQPYRDEPGAFSQPAGFYDPYRGPVPNTFAETMSDGHAESIPMTQMAAGMRSPGPQMAYDMQGRSSPAPQAAMGYPGMDERSRTPNPTAFGAGRNSPSPHPGYGYGPR